MKKLSFKDVADFIKDRKGHDGVSGYVRMPKQFGLALNALKEIIFAHFLRFF